MFSMFAELSDSVTERRIRGVRAVDSRPIVRRVRQRSGIGAARGIEITVTIDEKAFKGAGIFLLGAVLDRFFAEYSGFNHFTQTVIFARSNAATSCDGRRAWERANHYDPVRNGRRPLDEAAAQP